MSVRHHLLRVCIIVCLAALACVRASALTVAQRGNQVLIDGAPTPLTFARGCTDPAEVPLYHAVGFNTLLVQVDSPGSIALDKVEALMTAAESADMYVLLEIVSGDWAPSERPSLTSTAYKESVEEFLQEVVPRLRAHGNLVGWIISTVEEGSLVSDVTTFADYLKSKYGSLENLNAAWTVKRNENGTDRVYAARVPSLDARLLNEKTATKFVGDLAGEQLVRADIQAYREAVDARNRDFKAYLMTRYTTLADLNNRWGFKFAHWEDIWADAVLRREKEQPGSSPLSLLELARYQAGVPRLLLEYWAKQILQRDPHHLLFAGGQHRYRTLISLPPVLNGAYTECYPGVTEVDVDSHNPHAVDIARRGNRFIVLEGIQAAIPNGGRYRYAEPRRLANYLYEGAMHGAAGIAITDWPALRQSPGHASMVETALQDMRKRSLLGRTPAAHAAIVYSPYAPGPPHAGGAMYGYLPSFEYPGPGLTFFSLRHGTSYGQVDYLAVEDLTSVPLDRYQTILLPSVLDLPLPAQDALLAFAQDGGTVLADMGLGTLQATGDHYMLPARMMELFRVQNVPGVREVRFNLEVYRTHPRFPSLPQGYRTTGLGGGYMIAHAVRLLPMVGTDLLFAAVTDRPGSGGGSSNWGVLPRPQPRQYRPLSLKEPVYGMFIAPQNNGNAIFAPFPLYQFWTSGCQLFDAFHRDLFSVGADLVMTIPMDLTPAFAEVGRFTDGSLMVWTKDGTAPRVQVHNPKRRIYGVPTDSGWCGIGPDGTELSYSGSGYQVADALPVYLDDVPYTVRAAVIQANDQALTFRLETTRKKTDDTLTVRVGTGAYQVKPESRHLVTIITDAGGHDTTLRADRNGFLTIAVPSLPCTIMVTGTQSQVEVQPPPAEQHPESQEISIEATPASGG